MIASQAAKLPESLRDETLFLLTATAERLQHLVASQDWPSRPAADHLLDELLAAAERAGRQISSQRVRIRYLEGLSITDELTGLLNRRGFEPEMARALARAERNRETGLLLICDLDHFKKINDSYGHPAGDAVLRAVADLLRGHTRTNDYVARWGGDEFAMLMTDTAQTRAEALAEKLKGLINALVVEWRGHEVPVSASLGFAAYGKGSNADSLLYLADRALYRQKGLRVVHDSARS